MQILSPGARKRHHNKPRRSNLVRFGDDLVLVARSRDRIAWKDPVLSFARSRGL
jgi:hypothetical protein